MKKERPILFSTAMVQAILRGDKTETRRVLKPQPDINVFSHISKGVGITDLKTHVWMLHRKDTNQVKAFKCPYGQPGDLLWVRETFGPALYTDPLEYVIEYKAGGNVTCTESLYAGLQESTRTGWRPSIHMPKAAARIWLHVKSVDVERLHDIRPIGAQMEGIRETEAEQRKPQMLRQERRLEAFKELWQSINGPESWEQNPYVWVVKFSVLSTNGRP